MNLGTASTIPPAAPVTTGIVDLSNSEHACGPLLAHAAQQGLVAVITKCTEGKDYVDPSYAAMRASALAAGLLFGSFHFATGSTDGATQADWYLRHADPADLLCLDWEWSKHGNANLAYAEAFVSRVFAVTGRWPLVYTSRSYVSEKGVGVPEHDSVLGHCPLWVCSYGHNPPAMPTSPWSDWDLHQFTNGIAATPHYPTETPVLGKVDRSAFRGDAAMLRAWWAMAGREHGPQCEPGGAV